MTSILSWNIQNGRGVDGVVSLSRIAEVIRSLGDADVICLQEVSRGLALGDAGRPDQVEELVRLFPGYTPCFGAAVDARDVAGIHWQFGNLVLCRRPPLSVLHHPLPRPAEGGRRHMARMASEVVVETQDGALRVVNLHLEYHSAVQRHAQVAALVAMQAEARAQHAAPPATQAAGPYQAVARPVDAVYCGDFNMTVDSPEYRLATARSDDGGSAEAGLVDAWRLRHDRPHEPTCGVHDHQQWSQGPHCRDFFLLAGRCAGTVHELVVDIDTDASDHQPLRIVL